MNAIIVLTNAPDRAVAQKIAHALVERRLAACVNILAECTSVYRWQGAVETAGEVPLLIKTRSEIYAEVESAIKSLHPYELPEIVAVSVGHGSGDYLEWLNASTVTEIG
jgi:periplasmic divalent cation tolerance protein